MGFSPSHYVSFCLFWSHDKSDFPSNVPFFMQDIGVIYQILAKFHEFIVKIKASEYFFKENFLKKKAGNLNFWGAKLCNFWIDLTGLDDLRARVSQWI